MWWPATTSSPRVTATVLFSSRADGEDRCAATGTAAPWARARTRATGAAPGGGVPVAPHDRVVAADVDRPVVGEQAVDQRAQPGRGVVVVVGDRLVAEVAARHHERSADAGQQQVVERRVRQEHAEVGQARARPHRRWRSRTTPGAGASTIGRRGDSSAATASSSSAHSAPATPRSGTITANGLSSRALRRRSSRTAAVVGGVDREVVAADALDRHDRAAAERVDRGDRARRRRRRAPPPAGSRQVSRGPHSGQALGWAWKRRSDGSSYSARQAAHIVEAGHGRGRAVVRHAERRSCSAARSSVQFVNG